MIQLVEYEDPDGRRPFSTWARRLDIQARAKVQVALGRLRDGNFAGSKSVGSGVLEHRIDFGPGYRLYYGRDGDKLVVLLVGGTKRRQDEDIMAARALWADYKRRKAAGGRDAADP